MAEEQEQDQSQKTQPPSERRLQKAWESGDAPRSQELSSFLSLSAIFLGLLISCRFFGETLLIKLSAYLVNIAAFDISAGTLQQLAASFTREVIFFLSFPLALVFLTQIIGSRAMHPFITSATPLIPRLERVSPFKGLKRLFSRQNLFQMIKLLVKLIIITLAAIWSFLSELDLLPLLTHMATNESLHEMSRIIFRFFLATTGFLGVIAIIDAAYQRFSWMRQKKMTLEEAKQDQKESDGSPETKSRFKRLRQQRLSHRIITEVPKATFVITNPTHYAIALKYEETMVAPMCVAKGRDELALTIRRIAEENDVPVIEDPPLARTLHAAINVDEPIRPEHYKAVAEVVKFIMGLSRAKRRKR